MSQSKYKFVENERVLCFHGPLIYEAKCLTTQFKHKQNKYFIHYQGWNKNWDEWVPESRVLKWSEENLKLQQDLKNKHEPRTGGRTSTKSNKRKGGIDPVKDGSNGKDSQQSSTSSNESNKKSKTDKSATNVGSNSNGLPLTDGNFELRVDFIIFYEIII